MRTSAIGISTDEVARIHDSVLTQGKEEQRRVSLDRGRSSPLSLDEGDDDASASVLAAQCGAGPAEDTSVVFAAFTSTQDVVLSARRERMAMRNRRRQYERTSSDNDDSNLSLQPGTLSLVKDDFSSMRVIGQFNLGFILAVSRDNNLWILDQHACDEKYNFEKLMAETVISEQQLISPMPLELMPAEESCILDHMEIFEKNGFRFQVNLHKPIRHRLSLTALPHSGARDGRKAVQFGKEDVIALCAILGVDESSSSHDGTSGGGTGADGGGMYGNNAVRRYTAGSKSSSLDSMEKVIVRLPKAIAMFASRACRNSLMIGQALSKNEMDRIVQRLKDVEHPWNCPHGRPTMRHVLALETLLRADDQKARELIADTTVTMMSQEVDDSCGP
jgi:DNA mismatch repair ATPase MutL